MAQFLKSTFSFFSFSNLLAAVPILHKIVPVIVISVSTASSFYQFDVLLVSDIAHAILPIDIANLFDRQITSWEDIFG